MDSEWKIRVCYERADLEMQLLKLTAFISSEGFNKLEHRDRELLWEQLDIMKAYRKVLGKRILRFGI